jgi:hypothetical protein
VRTTFPASHAIGNRQSSIVNPNAFSLVEILVTMSLLSLIILGLLLMFNQTQRAFRSTMTQIDVLEAARATMDILARDLEQMAPSEYPNLVINGVTYRGTNFLAEVSPTFQVPSASPAIGPLVQELPGNVLPRTNFVQRFFFQTKVNQDWVGTGYQVLPDDPNGLVGTLYRFSSTNGLRFGLLTNVNGFYRATQNALFNAVQGLPVTNLSRVASGIVHLRIRPFAPNGFPIIGDVGFVNGLFRTNPITPFYGRIGQVAVAANNAYPDHMAGCYFLSNAVPAYVELEVGILEPQTLQRYRSIPLPAAQLQYLSNHVAQVHLFRQRIPIRNVDLTAYP